MDKILPLSTPSAIHGDLRYETGPFKKQNKTKQALRLTLKVKQSFPLLLCFFLQYCQLLYLLI